MKKSKFSTKLNLKKETISRLNLDQIKGGDTVQPRNVPFYTFFSCIVHCDLIPKTWN